jgi:hypothetical protein
VGILGFLLVDRREMVRVEKMENGGRSDWIEEEGGDEKILLHLCS